MNTKSKYIIVAVLTALALPLSRASAQETARLEFNNNSNDVVGGALQTITAARGSTITFQLDMVSSGGAGPNAVDYWLSQFSGPSGSNPFSITTRNESAGEFPDPSATDATVTSSADTFSNTSSSSAGHPDGIPDNLLKPQNGPDLGATTTSTSANGADGTNQIATFTLTISPSATLGSYQLRSLDYSGFGWSNTTTFDNPFSNEAAINVSIVPEPATLSLLGLSGLASFGLTVLRARRRLS